MADPRVGVKPKEPVEPGPLLQVEQAKSSRSTCRATGEKIEKGEWRVGMEAYMGGRVSTVWQKVLPFLRNCKVERCSRPSQNGTCKMTKHKFEKGEVRFTAVSGTGKNVQKMFLTFAAAAELLQPVFDAVGGDEFDALQVEGLTDLTAEERAGFYKAFDVSKKDAQEFDKDHPAPEKVEEVESPPKKRRKSDTAAKKDTKREGPARKRAKKQKQKEEESEGEPSAEEEPAASAGASADADVKEEDGEQVPAGDDVAAEEASPEPTLPLEPASPTSPINEFERVRQEHIRRNRQRMQELALQEAGAKLAPAPRPKKPAKPRGLPARRREQAEPQPRRQSLRVKGIAADGSRIDYEKRNGEVVLVNGEAIRYGPKGPEGAAWEPPPPRERHPKGPIEFRSSGDARSADARFIRVLEMQTAGSGKAPKSAATPAKHKTLLGLRLEENDVAKVTRDGVVHMAFHPRSDALILAAGDKGGRLGLWQIDQDKFEVPEAAAAEKGAGQASGRQRWVAARQDVQEAESSSQPVDEADATAGSVRTGEAKTSADEDEDDGILELTPHHQYISGLRWVGGSGLAARLLTVSYDGSLRMMDPGAGCAFQLLRSDEGAEYSAMDATTDGNTALLADKDGAVEVIDTRTAPDAKPAQEVQLHEKKINTLHVEPQEERAFVASVGDGTVSLWDVRKLGKGAKPVATAGHSYSCQAAYFAPDGSQRVVTTSRDNTLRVWDAKAGLAEGTVIRHNNNTGRWISPFRATWGAASDAIICGGMSRVVDVYDDKGSAHETLSSEMMTAIPSRCCVHAALPLLAAATASGRMHVYR